MMKNSKKTSHRTSRKWLKIQRKKTMDCKDAAQQRRYAEKNLTRRPIEEFEFEHYFSRC
jgi:hypothetical protein